jgi:hypothetical protein
MTADRYLGHRRTCVYVAKGPSAVRAAGYSDYHHVATVNEACLLVPGPVEYAFFVDLDTLEASRPAWDRIKTFVTPARLHVPRGYRGWENGSKWVGDVAGLPLHRVVAVEQGQIPATEEAVHAALCSDALPFTDTATLGLGFLHRRGYRRFLMFGHDGGVGYAAGVPHLLAQKDHTAKRQAIDMVGRMIGAEMDFFPPLR